MRASGVLMHITSLASPYGVGTMGKEAYETDVKPAFEFSSKPLHFNKSSSFLSLIVE